MEIVLSALDKGGDHSLPHDLNFQAERYEAKHVIVSLFPIFTYHSTTLMRQITSDRQTFKNPKPNLLALLKESGPTFGEENGVKPKRGDESKKKKRSDKGVC